MDNNKSNSLDLNLDDLLQDKNSGMLTILGDDKDSASISGNTDGFEQSSSADVSGNSFDVLSNGNLTIMIENGLMDDGNNGSDGHC